MTSFNPTVANNKNVEFIKAKKLTNQDKFKLIDNMLKTYPINFDCETTKTNFINCFANDPNLIINEVKKASSYSFDSEFTNDTINHLVTQNANDTIFDLVDLLSSKSFFHIKCSSVPINSLLFDFTIFSSIILSPFIHK